MWPGKLPAKTQASFVCASVLRHLLLYLKVTRVWRVGSSVKGTCCSSWGPEFHYQHPCWVAYHHLQIHLRDLVPSSNLCRPLYICSMYSHRHIQINKNTCFYFKEISWLTFTGWALSCGRVCVVMGIFGSGDYRGWQIYRKMVWNGTFKIRDEVQWH